MLKFQKKLLWKLESLLKPQRAGPFSQSNRSRWRMLLSLRPAAEPTVLDGVEINEQMSSTVLKEAARKLGLSTAGSRSRLYHRVQSFLDKQRLGLELQLASDAQQLEQREARIQPVPRQPSAQEKLLHEATHLPFQPWCGHYVSMRSMAGQGGIPLWPLLTHQGTSLRYRMIFVSRASTKRARWRIVQLRMLRTAAHSSV